MRVGPFTLVQVLGQGGMGVVWEARAEATGEAVALKLLTATGAADPSFVALFENEARSVAALDHPHIVTILDYGRVARAEAVAAGLAPGTPYLAMELAPGGTLAAPGPADRGWDGIRTLLLGLLGALGHAHARGIVHRDLKPANVLLDATRTVPRLSDFGLAHVGGPVHAGASTRSGTPPYMAPEQFLGQWRDFGPWTDLYALGALAWTLLCGAPPYGRTRDWTAAANAHLAARLPPFAPRAAVPPELEGWLAQRLARDPGDRFGRAADAADALRGMGPAVGAAAPAAASPERRISERTTVARPVRGPVQRLRPIACAGVPAGGAPRLAPDWRAGDVVPRRWLAGAGLGLFGIRAIPLVDREAARDALWEAAHRAGEGLAQAVVLRGAAGCGKSRLCEWLVQELHAAGAAEVLRAVHGPLRSGRDGLAPMVLRWLGATDALRSERVERARGVLARLGSTDPDDGDALAELADPAPPEDEVRVRLAGARERHQLLLAVLARVSRGRTVVVWLDDVQWGLDALRFALYALAASTPARLLLLLTAQDEALAQRPQEQAALEAVAVHPRARGIEVPPLPAERRPELVRGLLGLEGGLAKQVERRTGGNPLFAVQLVGDWVERRLLVPTPDGFRLAPGAVAEVPEDVRQLWGTRLQRVLRDRSPDDRIALELGALLGSEVDGAEWRAASARAAVRPSDGLVEDLVRQRLVRDTADGWAFVHGMVRETVEAETPDPWRLHRACAAALADLGRDPGRQGVHLLTAGDPLAAWPLLLAGAKLESAHGEYEAMLALVDAADVAVARLPPDVAADRWFEPALLRCEALVVTGRHDESVAVARTACARAEAAGRPDLVGRALLAEGQSFVLRREGEAARALLERAEGLIDPVRHPSEALRCQNALAILELNVGRFAECEARILRVVRDAEAMRNRSEVARAYTLLGCAREQQLRSVEAKADFERALAVHEALGNRLGQMVVLDGLGMIAFDDGDLDAALRLVERALALATAVGTDARTPLLLDLASVQLGRGDVDGARASLVEARGAFLRTGLTVRLAQCAARLLPVAARQADRELWNENEALAASLPSLPGSVQRHCAEALAEAAERAATLAWARESALADKLAAGQFAALGMERRP